MSTRIPMGQAKARRIVRKKPAQQRSKETVRAILEAAARILARDGYERTNVNRVADLYFQFRAADIRPRNHDLALAILRATVEAVAKVTSTRGDPEEEVIDELSHLVYGYVAREKA